MQRVRLPGENPQSGSWCGNAHCLWWMGAENQAKHHWPSETDNCTFRTTEAHWALLTTERRRPSETRTESNSLIGILEKYLSNDTLSVLYIKCTAHKNMLCPGLLHFKPTEAWLIQKGFPNITPAMRDPKSYAKSSGLTNFIPFLWSKLNPWKDCGNCSWIRIIKLFINCWKPELSGNHLHGM